VTSDSRERLGAVDGERERAALDRARGAPLADLQSRGRLHVLERDLRLQTGGDLDIDQAGRIVLGTRNTLGGGDNRDPVDVPEVVADILCDLVLAVRLGD